MKTETLAKLESVNGTEITLESVDIQAALQGLVSEVTVTQVYRNQQDTNIEAVYTFPLPLDAVLLDLSLELNGKKLRGAVKPSEEAEENYEDAIADGDSAVLMQKTKLDLFTINVGNLLPNEKAIIEFKYAQLHHWQGDHLRFQLPTTIAPKYGDPADSGLAEHEVPEYALSVDRGFSLTFHIQGELASAEVSCPSHSVHESTKNDRKEWSLSGGSAAMDRDFILVIRNPSQSAPDGLYADDHAGHVALASFHPVLPDRSAKPARCVKLVVDCSGSMYGDSIDQAKEALLEILPLLRSEDYFNLVTFGSNFKLLFPEPVPANKENLRRASDFIDRIDANMGGTELGAALEAAYHCGSIEGVPSDLLLVTDGHVYGEPILTAARQSRHRIFSVGVGSSVSAGFVQRISTSTGGAYELVSPKENMSERIVRHFRRMHQPKARSIRIEWPETPIRQIPDIPDAVYAGDTLHVFAWFNHPPQGKSRLVMELEDGRTISQDVHFRTKPENRGDLAGILPRIAAYTRLQTADESAPAQIAVDYQLLTEYTSYILVVEREEGEKLETLPVLRKVDHALAAGYGGFGTVASAPPTDSFHHEAVCLSMPDSPPPGRLDTVQSLKQYPASPPTHETLSPPRQMENLRIPVIPPEIPAPDAFLQNGPSDHFSKLVEELNLQYAEEFITRLNINTLDDLTFLGLNQTITDQLGSLISDTAEEGTIVIRFLMELSIREPGKKLSRHVKRLIRRAHRRSSPVPLSVSNEIYRLIERSQDAESHSERMASP